MKYKETDMHVYDILFEGLTRRKGESSEVQHLKMEQRRSSKR